MEYDATSFKNKSAAGLLIVDSQSLGNVLHQNSFLKYISPLIQKTYSILLSHEVKHFQELKTK